MQIEFVGAGAVEGTPLSAVAVLVFEGAVLPAAAEALDQTTGGAISRVLAGRFKGAKGQTVELLAPCSSAPAPEPPPNRLGASP